MARILTTSEQDQRNESDTNGEARYQIYEKETFMHLEESAKALPRLAVLG